MSHVILESNSVNSDFSNSKSSQLYRTFSRSPELSTIALSLDNSNFLAGPLDFEINQIRLY